jgi:signal recognition particle subunit SEC65
MRRYLRVVNPYQCSGTKLESSVSTPNCSQLSGDGNTLEANIGTYRRNNIWHVLFDDKSLHHNLKAGIPAHVTSIQPRLDLWHRECRIWLYGLYMQQRLSQGEHRSMRETNPEPTWDELQRKQEKLLLDELIVAVLTHPRQWQQSFYVSVLHYSLWFEKLYSISSL